MRCFSFVLAVAAASSAGLTASGVSAGVLNSPLGVGKAISDAQLTEKVHCVPGWPHHYYRPYNGCFRGYYYSGYPRAYYYTGYPGAYYYGGGPYIVGPGFSIGFGFGPRWGGWGWRW
jgi:hypothetical protein